MEYQLNYEPVMPKNKDVPIGLIGAGFIVSDCHLVAYRDAGFNPVAITSRGESARKAADRHAIPKVYDSPDEMLRDREIEVVDIGVPPDIQLEMVRKVVKHADHIRGILAQKPLGASYAEADEIVKLCRDAGITLAVNQQMRYDQSVRAAKSLMNSGALGEPVLATIDMRAIPHWMPWQERQGWCTLRIMSIHHLDTFRFWFGTPDRVFASTRPDPRTKFRHTDGICLYVLEYDESGVRASSWDDVWTGPAREGAGDDIRIHWRIEGTKGLAKGSIGWPRYPERTPSTLEYSTVDDNGKWHKPTWDKVWFPDAFAGPMAELLVSLETGEDPDLVGHDNLATMAVVEAAYESADTHAAVSPYKWLKGRG